MDGKHIAFTARKEDGSYYWNYKGYDSIVLLAMVDANCRFIYINIGCNGRVSDGGVLRRSDLWSIIERGAQYFPPDGSICNNRTLPYVIVGNNAFPLHKHLIKPYSSKSTESVKKNFNYRLSRARHTVEHAFGILSSRFRIFQSRINLDVNKVDNIVKACCALHNFLLDSNDRHIEGIAAPEELETVLPEEICDSSNASSVRDQFAAYFSNEGKLA